MSNVKEAILHWVLAHGEVRSRSYAPISTLSALEVLRERGLDVEESGEPSFEKIETELRGYGYEPKKEKVITMRVVPQGARRYSDEDFEFYVLREVFDLKMLGLLAGAQEDVDNESIWRTRPY